MPDTIPPVASQPVPPAQTSDGKSANISVEQLTRQFAKQDLAQPKAEDASSAPLPAAETTPVSPATSPEETPVVPPVETAVEGAQLTAPPEPTAPEPTPAADEALSHETSLAPELQAVIDKRIGKEVAKRKALEAEIEKLRATQPAMPAAPAANLPPVVIAPTAEQPLANIQDYTALNKVAAETRQIKYLAQEGLDTIEATGQDGFNINDRAYTRTELKSIIRNASRSLEEAIPQRANFLQERGASIQRAFEIMPALKEQGSPEHTQALAILRNPAFAHLNYVPNGIEQVALVIEGQKALLARTKPAEPAKPKLATPTKAPASQVAFGAATGATRAPASALEADKLAGELKKLSAKGGVTTRDAARFFALKEQLNSNRS